MAQRKDFNSAEEVSILSSGVKVEGKLYSEGNVRIDGQVIGDVTVNGNLTLGDGSEIKGEIKAKNVTISGHTEGTINSSEKIILENKSVVKGDLSCKILVIEEGAKFDGRSAMSGTITPKAGTTQTPKTDSN